MNGKPAGRAPSSGTGWGICSNLLEIYIRPRCDLVVVQSTPLHDIYKEDIYPYNTIAATCHLSRGTKRLQH